MARKMSKRSARQDGLDLRSNGCTALYLRVSTAGQVDGFSLDAQRARLDAYCVAMGWEVCAEHIYIEAGESGKTTDRPAFKEMLRAARDGQISRIVAIKLDRVARNTRAFLALVDELTSINVDLVLVAESFDTGTPQGRFALTMFAAMAELERSTITDRVMSGKRQKATVGGFNGAPAPYGYTYANGEFAIDLDRATVIERIFAEFVAGATMADIAQRLNGDGTPTARGGTWASATIRAMLRNGAYAGLSQWDGVESESATYPAIVDHDTYTAADRRLRALKPGKPAKVS